MSKKLVVSLFAGAVLLSAGSALAANGVVSGVCSDCHTMHNSQNGSYVNGTSTANDQLLLKNGCAGCHTGRKNATGTGKAATFPKAPQVDDTGLTLNGGYFEFKNSVSAANARKQHNVKDLNNDGDANLLASGQTTSPGGAYALGNATLAALECTGCHVNASHHTSTGTTYRMLSGANTSTALVNYGRGSGEARNGTAYDSAAMNLVCAGCHGTFHGTANQDGPATLDNSWIRHPTDISLTTVAGAGNAPSISYAVTNNYNSANDLSAVVVGNAGANDDMVMCISCHLPHGGAYDDLLAFNYSAGQGAGNGAAQVGCETCHTYTTSGM